MCITLKRLDSTTDLDVRIARLWLSDQSGFDQVQSLICEGTQAET